MISSNQNIFYSSNISKDVLSLFRGNSSDNNINRDIYSQIKTSLGEFSQIVLGNIVYEMINDDGAVSRTFANSNFISPVGGNMLAAKNKQFNLNMVQSIRQVFPVQKGIPEYIQGRSLLLRQGLSTQPVVMAGPVIKKFWISRFRIDYRYETSPGKNSEYYIKYITKIGATSNNVINKKVDEVKPKYKGTDITVWFNIGIFSLLTTPGNDLTMNAVTYEFDPFPTPNQTVYLNNTLTGPTMKVTMGSKDQFYQKIYNLVLDFPDGAFIDILGKGFVRIHRWDADV